MILKSVEHCVKLQAEPIVPCEACQLQRIVMPRVHRSDFGLLVPVGLGGGLT